jgi:hypothetical protein
MRPLFENRDTDPQRSYDLLTGGKALSLERAAMAVAAPFKTEVDLFSF